MIKSDKKTKSYDRLKWIDFAKGIAIIMVVCGHTTKNYPVQSLIFSFHMPLFFFLSGCTYRKPADLNQFIASETKSARRLLVPAYLIWVSRNILYFLILKQHSKPLQYLLSGILASGTPYEFSNVDIPAFGMMWFLVALFFTRTLYGCISFIKQNKIRISAVVIICLSGMLIGKELYLPFSMDVAMVAVAFFAGGVKFSELLNNTETFNMRTSRLKALIFCLACWISVYTIMINKHQFFEMAARKYPLSIVGIMMALAACFAWALLALLSENNGFLYNLFSGIGKESMLLFTIHAFDTVWFPYLKTISSSEVVLFALRLLIDLSILKIIVALKKNCHSNTK